jgi:succinyl-CoA synthetase alpha subunit
VKEIERRIVGVEEKLLTSLSEDEQRQLMKLLQKIGSPSEREADHE